MQNYTIVRYVIAQQQVIRYQIMKKHSSIAIQLQQMNKKIFDEAIQATTKTKEKTILTRIDKTQENKFDIPNTTKTFSVIEQQ